LPSSDDVRGGSVRASANVIVQEDPRSGAATTVAAVASPPAEQPLFRAEVFAERQSQWLGTVLLAPRISHRLFTAFALVTATAILATLVFADFTRKARINGWLVPDQGLVRIFAPMSGVVTRLHVTEGSEVRKGTPLIVLSTELQSEALGATREEIVRRLIRRRDSLTAERELQRQVHVQQMQQLAGRLAALVSEQRNLERERDLQKARVDLAEQTAQRQRRLRDSGIVPVQRVEQAEEERIDQAMNMRALERNWAAIEGQRLSLEGELRNLPLQHRALLADIERNIATLEQELAETEAQRQIVIPAPQDGTVTGIQAELGGSANTAVPLLSIVPSGSRLQAQLFSPSRAIGFVRAGQKVLLRYEAFPYQKFGHQEGVVVTVSRSAVGPNELTQQLSGLTSLYGTNEAVYRITVDLTSQTVTAYGKSVPLQAGMQLEADVLIENRRLIEWVLDPLYTITGK
jgi:membrane fusion protein